MAQSIRSRRSTLRLSSEPLEARFALTTAFAATALSGAPLGIVSLIDTDLDGDGDTDIIAASQDDDRISWYENEDGAGTFGSRRVVALRTIDVRAISVADLDGDGDQDLLAATNGGTDVVWYENDGLGEFGAARAITRLAAVGTSVVPADVDGDGDFDVITQTRAGVVWYENRDGKGDFRGSNLVAKLGLQSLLAADVDGDSRIDVVASDSKSVRWYQNHPDGTFTRHSVWTADRNTASPSTAVADIDSDGVLDFVISHQGPEAGRTIWYRNEGNKLSLPERIVYRYGKSIATVDIDQDGDIDVVSNSFLAGKMEDGRFRPIAGVIGYARLFTDVDGNGSVDVVTLSSEGEIHWHKNSGVENRRLMSEAYPVQTKSQVEDGLDARWFESVDLDSDGDLDLLLASAPRPVGRKTLIGWYENEDGHAAFGELNIIATGLRSAFPMDVDADGDLDVVSEKDDLIVWYENGGGAKFAANAQRLDSLATMPVHVLDVDGDQLADVISIDESEVVWSKNLGNGQYGQQSSIANDADAEWVDAADMNGDGDVDIVLALPSGVVWYEKTTGGFGERHLIIAGEFSATLAYMADAETPPDVILTSIRNESALRGDVGWLSNDGRGQFDGLQLLPVRFHSAMSAYGGDFDGDGDVDIVVSDTIRTFWLERQADDRFAKSEQINGDERAYTMRVADLNGDGDKEIITAYIKGAPIVWYDAYSVAEPPRVGDTDGDNEVGFTDFLTLSANFGKTDAAFADGDFDEDGIVTFADFLLLAEEFGRESP